MADDPRTLLAESVKDRSDEEIIAFAESLGGVEQTLDLTFEGMKSALQPERAQDCVIGYELSWAGETYHYTVTVQGGTAEVEKSAPDNPRVTLVLSVPDYLRLISGNLDGMQAFMQGKLKLRGDMMFATQIQAMFGA